MQIKVKRGVLLETLGKVKSAVPTRSTLPVLENVLLTAAKGQFTITSNNLEVVVIGTCKAQISEDGGIAVSPKVLEGFLKQVDAESVSLVVKRNKLSVEAGSASSTIEGFLPKDFPPIPKVMGEPITLYNLDKAIGEVLYAAAKEDLRPVLNGICLTPKGNGVELATADGYRLAITSLRSRGKFPEQVIVPSLTASLVKKLFSGNVITSVWGKDGDKAIGFHQNNGLTIVARTITGSYPKYESLVPKKGRLLKVAAGDLLKAVRTVMTIKPAHDTIRLQTKGRQLVVSGKNDGSGEIKIMVPAEGRIKSAFPGPMLVDLLNRVGDIFTLRKEISPTSPGVVRNNGTVHVLMPNNVTW